MKFKKSRSMLWLILMFLAFVIPCSTGFCATNVPPLEVLALVLSKTCPLPDRPELQSDSPESIKKSADDPSCPKHGDVQLIQTAITNRSKKALKIGVEIVVYIDDRSSEKKGLRKVIEIQSIDTLRVLHDIVLDKTGHYRIAIRLWDSKFKEKWQQTPLGEQRRFLIASPTVLQEAEIFLSGGRTTNAEGQSALQFDPPDLRWESLQVIPMHALRGERLKVRLNLMNVGGDIVNGANTVIEYFNTKQPRRKTIIATPVAHIMAPGEVVTFNLEHTLAEDHLVGNYQLVATVDPENEVKEINEENNQLKSNIVKLSEIKLLLPSEDFIFEENGLFLFQWDSLIFSEFKVQIGVDEKFEDEGAFYDLPQGDRWIADKEIVPLSGELPGMALGLMKSMEKNKLYWRVIGRRSTGQQAVSDILSFSIKPVTGI